VLFGGHLFEDERRLRVIGPQPLGIPPIDPAVILLGRYGESENLLFGQVTELAPVGDPWNHRLASQLAGNGSDRLVPCAQLQSTLQPCGSRRRQANTAAGRV